MLESVQKILEQYLIESKKTIAFVETCTSGGLAYELGYKTGATRYFKGAVVVNSAEAISRVLKIPTYRLKKGFINKDITEKMASEALNIYKSDISVAVTGYVNENDKDKKGRIYISVSSKSYIYSKEFNFEGSKKEIIGQAVFNAMRMVVQKEILPKIQVDADKPS